MAFAPAAARPRPPQREQDGPTIPASDGPRSIRELPLGEDDGADNRGEQQDAGDLEGDEIGAEQAVAPTGRHHALLGGGARHRPRARAPAPAATPPGGSPSSWHEEEAPRSSTPHPEGPPGPSGRWGPGPAEIEQHDHEQEQHHDWRRAYTSTWSTAMNCAFEQDENSAASENSVTTQPECAWPRELRRVMQDRGAHDGQSGERPEDDQRSVHRLLAPSDRRDPTASRRGAFCAPQAARGSYTKPVARVLRVLVVQRPTWIASSGTDLLAVAAEHAAELVRSS